MGGGVIYMLTYFNDGGPSDLFRSEMLARSCFFFGLWKTPGFWGGGKKKTLKDFGGYIKKEMFFVGVDKL